MGRSMDFKTALFNAITTGNNDESKLITEQAIADGADPETLVNDCMIPAMTDVGNRFERGEFFLPELLIAARAMKTAMALLRPLLAQRGAKPAGRVVIGTVLGDQHDIGKNLVASLLEGGGFEGIDLGFDVSPRQFVDAVRNDNPDIIGMSALLTTTMPAMKSVVQELTQAGIRDRTRIMIGGAPVTQRYADEIGADGYADNANSAVALARSFISRGE